MINPEWFYNTLWQQGLSFYTGVPDSLLKNLCAYITDMNAHTQHNEQQNKLTHVIAANEGGAMGIAAGYHLATGRIPVVYMQNSGEGNIINPLTSLTDKDVYGIPVLLIVGWRGQPGVHDEPQHVKQGRVTLSLLDALEINYNILSKEEHQATEQIKKAVAYMKENSEPFALIVEKDTFLPYTLHTQQESLLQLSREEAIQTIAAAIDELSVVISTTGMISRELFEYREHKGGHEHDFLTVGSMGHASQIALGIALQKPNRRVFCFDGDGAAIMHLGAMAIIGQTQPANYYHIVFNNGAHDSVGGQPTAGFDINIPKIASGCGYKTVISVDTKKDLEQVLPTLTEHEAPLLLEIKVKKGNRKDLGRPNTTPKENKKAFMNFIK